MKTAKDTYSSSSPVLNVITSSQLDVLKMRDFSLPTNKYFGWLPLSINSHVSSEVPGINGLKHDLSSFKGAGRVLHANRNLSDDIPPDYWTNEGLWEGLMSASQSLVTY